MYLNGLARECAELHEGRAIGVEAGKRELEFLQNAKSPGLKAQVFPRHNRENTVVCPEYPKGNCSTCKFEHIRL